MSRSLFNKRWTDCPIVVIDYETTGLVPGADKAVSVGVARFESGMLVDGFDFLINPGVDIPEEATAIHGITNTMVSGLPESDEIHLAIQSTHIMDGAQVAAYNATFDRWFCPWWLSPVDWPWLDVLPIVRTVDRYARGKGRHKLAAACARHGVVLEQAHSAKADAVAAGELLFRLVPAELGVRDWTLGEVLHWTLTQASYDWFDFQSWLAQQPEVVS